MTEAVLLESPLPRLLDSIEMGIVDIGARGKPLSFMKPLMPFARYVACEPDAEEAARLAEDLRADGRWLRTTVFSEAIASAPGEAQLIVTHHPGMSSLLEPDAAVVNRYCKAGAFEVVHSTTVPTVTLDDAAERHGFENAGFLKIDTQGTELDILRSGERLVSSSVVGVYVEALFQPFYRGQSLFSDLDMHLRARGFSLFDLARTHLRRASAPAASYSRRPIVWAHCLFLKEPSALDDLEGAARARALRQLGALAIAFEHYDFALEILGGEPSRLGFDEASAREAADMVATMAARRAKQLVRYCITQADADDVVACAARDDRGP